MSAATCAEATAAFDRHLPTGTRVVVIKGTRYVGGTIAGTDPGHYHATVNGRRVYLVQFDDAPAGQPGSGWMIEDFVAVNAAR